MKKITPTIFLCFLSLFLFSQKKPNAPAIKAKPLSLNKTISSDCANSIKINVSAESYYGPTVPPKGFGETQEFSTNNKLTFEGEHNSAWYLLTIVKDGELIFEIIPQDTANDYDFLLFNYSDSTFCDNFKRGSLKPIRSNLSNIKKTAKGITGLSSNTNKNSIGEGIGMAFSKSIAVKNGEKYMLVLDNVTPEGKGHSIYFYYMKDVEIKGNVSGSDSIPLVAEITLSDNKGNVIAETKSNEKGEYLIKTAIKENKNYSLTYISENEFVQIANINTKSLKNTASFPNIKTVLPKLKKGEKYKLGNIIFVGNEATLLPGSISSVEALAKLMQKNKKLKIQIEGHVNADQYTQIKENKQLSIQYQVLSESRAMTVYDYLLSKKISKDRMTTIGYGGSQMLFPKAKSEIEQSANRRVEIKVTSIE